MDETNAGSSSSWETWIQRVGGNVVDAWSSSTYQQPYELQKMRIQSLGERGYYPEGKPMAQPGSMNGISPIMLIGGVLLLVLLLRKA